MSEFSLSTKNALNLDEPVSEHWPGFSLREIENERHFWLAVSAGAEDGASKTFEKQLGAPLPQPGQTSRGESDGRQVLVDWAGERQFLVSGAPENSAKALAGKAWLADQSDGWVGFTLEGGQTRAVLEKLCPIDLHPSVFGAGRCARIPVETMIALIACDDVEAQRYRLYFQRSSARSFVDHIRHAAYSTCGEKSG